jgi:hypothetical protein
LLRLFDYCDNPERRKPIVERFDQLHGLYGREQSIEEIPDGIIGRKELLKPLGRAESKVKPDELEERQLIERQFRRHVGRRDHTLRTPEQFTANMA